MRKIIFKARVILTLIFVSFLFPIGAFADITSFTAHSPATIDRWADYTISPQGSGTNYYYVLFPPGSNNFTCAGGQWVSAFIVKEGTDAVPGNQWLGNTGEYYVGSGTNWQGYPDFSLTGTWTLAKIDGGCNTVNSWNINNPGFSTPPISATTSGAITIPTVWAMSALAIAMITVFVYFGIFFFIFFVIAWGLVFVLRPIHKILTWWK